MFANVKYKNIKKIIICLALVFAFFSVPSMAGKYLNCGYNAVYASDPGALNKQMHEGALPDFKVAIRDFFNGTYAGMIMVVGPAYASIMLFNIVCIMVSKNPKKTETAVSWIKTATVVVGLFLIVSFAIGIGLEYADAYESLNSKFGVEGLN